MTTARIKALIAEDEPLIALALQAELRELGYDVAGIAATAEEALDLARRHAVGLAVVDVRLASGSDGLWATRRLTGGMGIPVVVCSACTRPEDALAAGASAFLPKPYSRTQLRGALAAAGGQRGP
jgi:CheY-like chemotaxis protein